MIKIRRGCFETNSSSTHAVIITKEEPEFICPDIDLSIGEFGWAFNVYNYDDEKASYLYTATCSLYGRDVYDEIQEMLAPYGVRCYSKRRAEFKSYSGIDGEYLDNGYIDHDEDCKTFVDYVMSDPEHLICFLFSEQSYIVTGNDNCDDIDVMWFRGKIHKADGYEHETFYKGN